MSQRRNDAESLDDALRELDEALSKFFYGRVPSVDAEDLLQECYLKVSRGLPELEDHERLSAWVFTIARNVVVDYFRTKKDLSEEDLALVAEQKTSRDRQDSDTALEVGRWLAPMISQLPEKYAVALRESELKERPHREIAEQLDMSVSGIKSRVQRGRALLREKLNACCALKFDRRGGIRGVERRNPDQPDCCGPDDCC